LVIDLRHPDAALVEALLSRDEAAFRDLVTRYHRSFITVARQYVSSPATAEEVAQETWLAVIRTLPKFEGRSSLKTWMFAILTNQARGRGSREHRIVPLSSVMATDSESVVDPSRFLDVSNRWGGHWANPPRRVEDLPEECLEGAETMAALRHAIATLPDGQQRVMWLRDVKGWTADEVCTALDLSEANQRVLLHRARSKVRAALENQLESDLSR
jgi:RNA polymerase sigma-70 factor, ECF subfamily